MSPLNWFKKESPLQGLTGLWGGVGSNLVAGAAAAPAGQWARITSGTVQWTCPAGVKSVSIVTVGGGGGGGGDGPGGGSGGGGGMSYRNDISVSAGTSYEVICGAGGGGSANSTGQAGQTSSVAQLQVSSGGGGGGVSGVGAAGGASGQAGQGDAASSGGPGSAGNNGGGGGGGSAAGNYNNGGTGAKGGEVPHYGILPAGQGQGGEHGGGAGGFSGWGNYGGAGGGTLIYGEGLNAQGSAARGGEQARQQGEIGSIYVGGSQRGGQFPVQTISTNYRMGARPGSGGVGNVWGQGANGGQGAVRIIWPGDERQFPTTRTVDE